MSETFLSAGTKLDGLVEKMNEVFEKAAALVAEALMDRAKNGNINQHSTEVDVNNLIKGFTVEEQNIILSKAIVMVAMNSKSSKTKTSNSYYDDDDDFNSGRSGIFRNRKTKL